MLKLRVLLKVIVFSTLFLITSVSHITMAEDSTIALREYLLKAKVVNSISNFTSWPAKANDLKPAICILGDNSNLYEAMTLFYQHHTSFNPEISLINSTSLADIESCQIVYIAKLEKEKLKAIIARINKKPILLFSDNSGYAELGVHINLYIDNNKVRFEVNHDASKQAGLAFSSQFLRLAKIVKGEV